MKRDALRERHLLLTPKLGLISAAANTCAVVSCDWGLTSGAGFFIGAPAEGSTHIVLLQNTRHWFYLGFRCGKESCADWRLTSVTFLQPSTRCTAKWGGEQCIKVYCLQIFIICSPFKIPHKIRSLWQPQNTLPFVLTDTECMGDELFILLHINSLNFDFASS